MTVQSHLATMGLFSSQVIHMNKIMRWAFFGQLNCQSLVLMIFILNSIFPYSKECKIHLCKNTGSVTSTAFLFLKKFLSPIEKTNKQKKKLKRESKKKRQLECTVFVLCKGPSPSPDEKASSFTGDIVT